MTKNKWAPIRPLMHTDAYKLVHKKMWPTGTDGVLSNYTNRGSRVPGVDHVVHFGLQAFLQTWAMDAWRPFFDAEEDVVANLYEEFLLAVLGPNDIGSDHIRELHQARHLPLVFRAVPEGTLVPMRVPSFTIENTDPRFAWLVNYVETAISSSYWHASTSATTAYHLRTLFDEWALKTTGSTAGVEWQGHDFSFRGQTSIETAAASAAGHLLSFMGSDGLGAMDFIEDNYYGATNGQLLGSVPATEHSVMTAGGGDPAQEDATYARLINEFPSGILAMVSDTYNLWRVVTETLPKLKDQIMARDGKVVIRPDSGDPVDILTGVASRPEYQFNNSDGTRYVHTEKAPQYRGLIELLWDVFGGTINEQGYKVLDSHIGAIYGDSITYDRAEEIFTRLEAKGFASTNVVLGVGSYVYQYVTRDTYGSAVKATWVSTNGIGRDIFKNPITDSGLKKSAKGRLAVVRRDDDDLHLIQGEDARKIENTSGNLLEPIWRNGEFLKYQAFADVRATLQKESLRAKARKSLLTV